MPDKPLEKGQNSVEPKQLGRRGSFGTADPHASAPGHFRRTDGPLPPERSSFSAAVALFWLDKRRARPQQLERYGQERLDRATDPRRFPTAPFTDITAAAGIRFVHNNGAYGEKLLPETMGGGCGLPRLSTTTAPRTCCSSTRPTGPGTLPHGKPPPTHGPLPQRRQRPFPATSRRARVST